MYTKNAAEKANLSTSSYYWYKTDATGSGITTRYSKTSTTVLNEGEYIRLYSCASNYIRTIDYLVYHCEYNSSTDIYEWRPVSGYTDGTCIPTNCTAAKAAEKSGLSESSNVWMKTNSTGSSYILFLGKNNNEGLAKGTYLTLYTCKSGYTPIDKLIYQCVKNGTEYEWQEVSGYSSGTCVAVTDNCTPTKAGEKSGLSKSSKYWIVTDSTGSRDLLQINLGVVSTVGLAGGVYLKLFSCASGYRLSGTLIYHCEYNSGTDTYEWNEVSGYSSGTCVEE